MTDFILTRDTPAGPAVELTDAFAALAREEQRDYLQRSLAHCVERMQSADTPEARQTIAAEQEILTYMLNCLEAGEGCASLTVHDVQVHKPGRVLRPD